MYVSRQECLLHPASVRSMFTPQPIRLFYSRINQLHVHTMACRADKEAFVKVGQTFLSAVLNVRLPEGSRKKGLRRLYRANTRGPAAAWPRVQLRKHL